jgi:dTMP kinase
MIGKLITFEGIDGSGKTTQINLLEKKFIEAGYSFIILREPGGTDLSEKIRKILLDRNNMRLSSITESLLFVAARSQLMSEKILPALEKDQLVICDRFMDSTVAYQGYGRGLDVNYLEKLNYLGTYGRQPDLTIILDVDPREAAQRLQEKAPDRMESAGMKFFSKVQKGYHKIASQYSDRCILINSNRSPEDVFKAIFSEINDKIIGEITCS